MANYFHIFAKKKCKFCGKATKILESKGLPFVITYTDNAPQALADIKEHCQWKTVPIIFEVIGQDDSFVGGYTELEEYLNGSQEEEGRGEGTDHIAEG
jgi:glutaredoxin